MSKRTIIITTACKSQVRTQGGPTFCTKNDRDGRQPMTLIVRPSEDRCFSDGDDEEDYEEDEFFLPPAPKRERLTHLTQEQKLARRKLKNRIAAQTARDRKKVLMNHLEKRYRALKQENETIRNENSQIKTKVRRLEEDNERLKVELATVQEPGQLESAAQSVEVTSKSSASVGDAFGSAASINVPLQREQASSTTPATVWTLRWVLTLMTAFDSSKSSERFSANTRSLLDQTPWEKVFQQTSTLPLNRNQLEMLTSKLNHLHQMWKSKRQKYPEE